MQKWMADPNMNTTIRTKFDFEKVPEAISDSAAGNKSEGKVQLVVNLSLMNEDTKNE